MTQKPIPLTNDEIDNMTREELRAAAEEYELDLYSTHKDIFTMVLDSDIVGRSRIMRAYADLLMVIQDEFHQDPPVAESNGYQVTVKRWQSDDYLWQSLRSSREYRTRQAEKEKGTEE